MCDTRIEGENCKYYPALINADGIDIDVCEDVLVKNCYFEVNDDFVVLKGGKGPYANTLPENGSNERIIVEDCEYGFCHEV